MRIQDIALALVPLIPSLYYLLLLPPTAFGESMNARYYVLSQLFLSILAFMLVVVMIPVTKEACRRKGLSGKDLGKKGTPAGELDVPESQGIAPAVIYIIIIIICQSLFADTAQARDTYSSSLLSICFMLFLGFVDDVLVSLACFSLPFKVMR